MEKLTIVSSVVAVLDRGNVDTDQIIPKQFLRSISRTGFGQFLFDSWRYLDHGELEMDCSVRPQNPDFSLNEPRYQGAQILLTRENFGCGSSREHAVWALTEYGFRVIIAPSFGDIFANNALKNGLLPLVLPMTQVEDLFAKAEKADLTLTVDLPAQELRFADGTTLAFDISADDKNRLIEGLDDIAETLSDAKKIKDYEKRRQQQEPWLFNDWSL